MYFPIVVFVMVVLVLEWKRTSRLGAVLDDLSARVGALEATRQPVAHPSPAVSPPAPSAERRAPVAASVPVPRAVAAHTPIPSPERRSVTSPPPAWPGPPGPADTALHGGARPPGESLETRIGSRWLLYIGVIAIIVGVGYFEKLAIDNPWVGETARVVQGAIIGLVLVLGGLRFVRAGYRVYGQMICGCGIAVLYVSTYAAFNFYHLVHRPAALLLMCSITAAAAWLADRLRSQGLALMAAGGGFLTPFLLSSGIDAQIALFGYDATLIAGTMYLAHRRDWPALNLASYILAVLTVAAWAAAFYEPSKYLPTELFLTLYCGMFLYVLRETRAASSAFGRLAHAALWTAPVAYYLSSLAVLVPHPVPLLIFLIALTVTGAIVATRFASSRVGLLFLAAVQAPLLLWIDGHAGRTWLTPGLTTVVAAYAMNLLAQRDAATRRQLDETAIWWLHLNALSAYGGAYLLVGAVNGAATGPLAFGFALWHVACAFRLKTRNRPLAIHFAALSFTLAALGVTLSFDGAWITVAWAAEGAAILWLGMREERDWLRVGGLFLFAVAVARLLGLLFSPPRVDQVVLLNRRAACAAFVIVLTYLLTWAHQRRTPRVRPVEIAVGLVTAKLLMLALAAGEIVAFWANRQAGPFEPAAQLVMAWSVAGLAVSWLGLERREPWVRAVGGLLVGLGAIGLLVMQPESVPPGYVVWLNGRAIAGAVAVASMYGLAFLHRKLGTGIEDLALRIGTLVVAASVLTLTTLSSEITAYWHLRDLVDNLPFAEAIHHRFARELMLSVTWATYATALIVAGIRKRYSPIRYLAMAVFAGTIAKVFLVDLARLDQVYRVLSIVGLGIALLMTSFLYHRFRARLAPTPGEG